MPQPSVFTGMVLAGPEGRQTVSPTQHSNPQDASPGAPINTNQHDWASIAASGPSHALLLAPLPLETACGSGAAYGAMLPRGRSLTDMGSIESSQDIWHASAFPGRSLPRNYSQETTLSMPQSPGLAPGVFRSVPVPEPAYLQAIQPSTLPPGMVPAQAIGTDATAGPAAAAAAAEAEALCAADAAVNLAGVASLDLGDLDLDALLHSLDSDHNFCSPGSLADTGSPGYAASSRLDGDDDDGGSLQDLFDSFAKDTTALHEVKEDEEDTGMTARFCASPGPAVLVQADAVLPRQASFTQSTAAAGVVPIVREESTARGIPRVYSGIPVDSNAADPSPHAFGLVGAQPSLGSAGQGAALCGIKRRRLSMDAASLAISGQQLKPLRRAVSLTEVLMVARGWQDNPGSGSVGAKRGGQGSSTAVAARGLQGAAPQGVTHSSLLRVTGGQFVPLFSKRLTQSDISRMGRIILPRAAVEAHLPPCADRDGVSVELFTTTGEAT